MSIIKPVEPVRAARYGPAARAPQATEIPASVSRLTSGPQTLPIQNCLFHHVRKQTEKARPLYGLSQLALPFGGDRGYAAGHNLAAFRDKPLQQLCVLIIDFGGVGTGERT